MIKTLKLTEQELALVYRALIKFPFETVNKLIHNIENQLLEQPADE